MLFLWSVDFTQSSREIKLVFLDSSNGKLKKFSIDDYKPYFLAKFPLSKQQKEAVESIQGEVEPVTKRNLFSDETIKLEKVKQTIEI